MADTSSMFLPLRVRWTKQRRRCMASGMGKFPARIVAFLRWLFSSEELPVTSGPGHHPQPRPAGLMRWLLSADQCADEPGAKPTAAFRQHFLAWVCAPEELPVLPAETPDRSQSLWLWIMRGEELPGAPAAESQARARRGFVRWLLSGEVCPPSPAPSVRRQPGLLRWLLASENL